MIISASRRTDIPAFYSDWFFERLREKYVLVRNPINPRQVGRIDLSPDVVDGIVFWTKNPLPMLNRLEPLRDYTYYFQFTLTSYGTDTEPYVPSKNDELIPAFKRLSDLLGPDRVVWRYDPIFLNDKYTVAYHAEYFDRLAGKLQGYAKKCVISFMDTYRHNARRLKTLKPIEMTGEREHQLARCLAQSAARSSLTLETCAESADLRLYGVGHGRCVDAALLEKAGGETLDIAMDKGQRAACLCHESIDIGTYGTCRHGCVYCYADRDTDPGKKAKNFDVQSPILCGEVSKSDRITPRAVKSARTDQLKIRE